MLDSQQFNLDPLSQLWRCDDGKGLEIREEEDGTERLIIKPLSDEPEEMATYLYAIWTLQQLDWWNFCVPVGDELLSRGLFCRAITQNSRLYRTGVCTCGSVIRKMSMNLCIFWGCVVLLLGKCRVWTWVHIWECCSVIRKMSGMNLGIHSGIEDPTIGYQSDEFFFENLCNQKKGDKKKYNISCVRSFKAEP